MSKKVLVISTSLRPGSNSQALADAFAQGAESAGHQVERVSLAGKSLAFCQGCLSCLNTHRCAIQDDGARLAEQMHGADVLVFATPIYYYEMAGQLKTLLDRANPLFASDYKFQQVYLLSTAADGAESTPERAVAGLEGWICCFGRAKLAGTVFAGGVDGVGEIQGHPALAQAQSMGAAIQ